MSKRDTPPSSELVSAAQSLDAELLRFEALSEQLKEAPLTSEKHLERASKTLKDLADLDDALRMRVGALVQAITGVRNRQQAQADAVNVCAQELQLRTEVFKELLTRYGALGQSAADLNGRMQEFASLRQQATRTAEEDARLTEVFTALQARMAEVADDAATLTIAAEEAKFTDIGRQADSLRQQLLSARNKLGLLHQSLSK
ncbi:hypothetical protein D7Y27_42280 [Corallococcus sp. AB004]|uniref:hypothetical protein n=1 Tax=Corallococcus TaxID=83461 RepID=UPI000EA35BC1|nr:MULTISPECIES: hypothetical protein [Corallococcus]NPD30042.1 hypothetical protein [Corallococcus exiguus]NRD51047.1 hypothetical protein [Corallococcus exiguus]RKI03656.1 hypothetical protein D7Y04_01385 [Corallococcus sp. AB038B]RKI25501.1 hypothetical protein D7Y27_42280 [Corallococcus sp. AB004]